LREALEKIIEWCDGTRGADFDKAPFEAIGDCARAALSRSPSKPEEPLREAVEKAIWWIRSLRDSPKPSWTVITQVAAELETALSRDSAPVTEGERWWNKGQAELAGNPEYEAARVELEENVPAKAAEPALGLNIVEDNRMPEGVMAVVARDERGNVTQRVFVKNIDKPPAPRVWRCIGCGQRWHGKHPGRHNVIGGHDEIPAECNGPVEEVKP
jgi:hypothetical protein